MNINKINHLSICENDDGTYKMSGKVNNIGFISIPRANIKLDVEMLALLNNSDEKMCDISFE